MSLNNLRSSCSNSIVKDSSKARSGGFKSPLEHGTHFNVHPEISPTNRSTQYISNSNKLGWLVFSFINTGISFFVLFLLCGILKFEKLVIYEHNLWILGFEILFMVVMFILNFIGGLRCIQSTKTP